MKTSENTTLMLQQLFSSDFNYHMSLKLMHINYRSFLKIYGNKLFRIAKTIQYNMHLIYNVIWCLVYWKFFSSAFMFANSYENEPIKYSKIASDDTFKYCWDEEWHAWSVGGKCVSTSYPTGIKGNCPKNIVVPQKTPDGSYIEIVGYAAFQTCGSSLNSSVSIYVHKRIRAILEKAFSLSYYIERFEIEAGSNLEFIGMYGIHYVGNSLTSAYWSKTLVLPRTLNNVSEYAIYNPRLFKEIIYCGTSYLSKKTNLEIAEIDLIVSHDYLGSDLFGYKEVKRRDIEKECGVHKTPSMSPSPSLSQGPVTNGFRRRTNLQWIFLSPYQWQYKSRQIPILRRQQLK